MTGNRRGWIARRARLAALALVGTAAWPAQAQWLGQDYATYGAPLSSFMHSSMVNNLTMIQAAEQSAKDEQRRGGKDGRTADRTGGNARDGGTASGRAPAALALRADAPPAVQRNAAGLAQHFPPEQRATMTRAFADSMGVWAQLEAKLGLPRNDVGGALAAFLVGNYMVMTGKEVSDEEFGAVVEQLRRQPSLHKILGGQSPAALRNLYEQSAMTGTFMALAYKSGQANPPPPAQQANLRQAARENLRTVGLDPDRLHIGMRGISMGE